MNLPCTTESRAHKCVVRSSSSIAVIGETDCGKSTLIGRLLMETRSIPANFIRRVKKLCNDRNIMFQPAYLIDHMREERQLESTLERTLAELKIGDDRFPIIDTPGQLMLAKKMVSGLAEAGMVLIVLDVLEQNFKKYSFYFTLVSLLRIPDAIIVINKMDLINYDRHEYEKFVSRLRKEAGLSRKIPIIPVSALKADNLVEPSKSLSYYRGGSLLDKFVSVAARKKPEQSRLYFLMPVQGVINAGKEKVAMGMVAEGRISVGEPARVADEDSGTKLSVKRIYCGENEVPTACKGENAGIVFHSQKRKIVRGDILIHGSKTLILLWQIDVRLYIVEPFSLNDLGLHVRFLTNNYKMERMEVKERFDFQLRQVKKNSAQIFPNEFVRARIIFNRQGFPLLRQSGRINKLTINNRKGSVMAIGVID